MKKKHAAPQLRKNFEDEDAYNKNFAMTPDIRNETAGEGGFHNDTDGAISPDRSHLFLRG